MSNIIQYCSKAELLLDLEKVSDKIDTKASSKLPVYCVQDKEGKQYLAKKFIVMINLINSIEGKEVINPNKSRTFRKRFMSCCWKDTLPTTKTPVEVETPVEVVNKNTKKTTTKKTKK